MLYKDYGQAPATTQRLSTTQRVSERLRSQESYFTCLYLQWTIGNLQSRQDALDFVDFIDTEWETSSVDRTGRHPRAGRGCGAKIVGMPKDLSEGEYAAVASILPRWKGGSDEESAVLERFGAVSNFMLSSPLKRLAARS